MRWLKRLEKTICKRLFCDDKKLPTVMRHKFEERILSTPEVHRGYLHCVWCEQDFFSI